ncbi:melatonin receptor type 1C-like [Styela clava]
MNQSYMWANSSDSVDITTGTRINYWPQFGVLQYFEFAYIVSIIALGSLGNLVVIFSIILDKKVHSGGNIFIINLAIADFFICSITLPCIAVTIIKTKRVVDDIFCEVVGFIVTATCACSLCNLALIAANRYWAIVKSSCYRQMFSKRAGLCLAMSAWIWSIAITMPTVLGWGDIAYDAKSLICGWHDAASLSYAIFLIVIAVVLPLGTIIFSYYNIFREVRSSLQDVRSLGKRSISSQSSRSRSLTKERNLVYTLMTTVVVFFVCWTPYAAHALVNPSNVKPHVKKVLVWLALSNSCVNFIIYGVMNQAFKKRYKKLFNFIFQCGKCDQSASMQLGYASANS